MPFNFTGIQVQYQAKKSIVSDGEVITVASDGYTVTSTLSPDTAFASNPVRSVTGVWSATMKDSYNRVTNFDVRTLLPTGSYLGTQLISAAPSATTGQLVLKWVFNSAGTPTDLPALGKFIISISASESSL